MVGGSGHFLWYFNIQHPLYRQGLLKGKDIVDAVLGVLGAVRKASSGKTRPAAFQLGNGIAVRGGIHISAQNNRLLAAVIVTLEPFINHIGLPYAGDGRNMVQMGGGKDMIFVSCILHNFDL